MMLPFPICQVQSILGGIEILEEVERGQFNLGFWVLFASFVVPIKASKGFFLVCLQKGTVSPCTPPMEGNVRK